MINTSNLSVEPDQAQNDMDKLLREDPDGLWFVTLDSASSASWNALEAKLRKAFESLPSSSTSRMTTVHFALCGVRPRLLRRFSIDFGLDWRAQLDKGFEGEPEEI